MTNTYMEQLADHVQDIITNHAIGAAADHGFDAGEWSGPAHARMEQREIDEYCAAHCVPSGTVVDILHARTYEGMYGNT